MQVICLLLLFREMEVEDWFEVNERLVKINFYLNTLYRPAWNRASRPSLVRHLQPVQDATVPRSNWYSDINRDDHSVF
jgi:hypothetical protein